MIESSKRLKAVFHMTPAVHSVGDIGCDHGYISHALLKANRAEKVIATDISAPSLNKAATLLQGAFKGRFETRLGDGFAPIDAGEIQGAIIMGMGGQLIADILARGKDLVDSLDWCILQPMQGTEDLFDYLNRSGFALMQSNLVEERGKFYPLLLVKKGEGTAIDWKNFARYEDFIPMAEKELKRLRSVRRAVEKSGRAEVIEKADADVKIWEGYLEYSRTHQ